MTAIYRMITRFKTGKDGYDLLPLFGPPGWRFSGVDEPLPIRDHKWKISDHNGLKFRKQIHLIKALK